MPPWEKLSTSLAEKPARVNALRAQILDARRKYGKIKVYEANTGVLRPLHPMFRKGAIPVEMKLAYDTPETIRELFTEYTRMLVENEPAFQTYLDLQDYAAELADLTKKYGLPHGRLYIAWCDDRPVGCIGLRRLDNETCELKRLYVRPAYRGQGIAGQMMQRILSDARAIGYTAMQLDTEPFLRSALKMYRGLGFYDIPRYTDSPLDTTIFLRLEL